MKNYIFLLSGDKFISEKWQNLCTLGYNENAGNFPRTTTFFISLGRFITLFEGIASNNLVRSYDSHSYYYCRQLHIELHFSRTILDVITEFRMRSKISY